DPRISGDRLHLISDGEVALEVLAGEPRVGGAEVGGVELVGRADGASQETLAERRVRHEADAEFAQQRQHLGLLVARPQRVLRLQCRDRVDGVRAADRRDPRLRQPYVANLALGDQLGDGSDGVLDRGVRVDWVRVVQVDPVGSEPLQRPLYGRADAGWAAVELALLATGGRDHAEL